MNPRFYLRVRGLDSNPSQAVLLRDEFRDYIDDPETQKRKREVVRKRAKEARELRKQKVDSNASDEGVL